MRDRLRDPTSTREAVLSLADAFDRLDDDALRGYLTGAAIEREVRFVLEGSSRMKKYIAGAAAAACLVAPAAAGADLSTALSKAEARAAIRFLDANKYRDLGTHIKSCERLAANRVSCVVAVHSEIVACPAGNFSTPTHSWHDIVTRQLIHTVDWQGPIEYTTDTVTEYGRTLPNPYVC